MAKLTRDQYQSLQFDEALLEGSMKCEMSPAVLRLSVGNLDEAFWDEFGERDVVYEEWLWQQ